ncbi:unnamed protein product [Spirodela intermedia]|uniref:Calcium-transporting ATPase n=1 Tax=Spirodela intermedia TaxID=51605 RepID=A0A7I8IAY2_SPIIN|nr:unnamed protein product [Spirodela intermedia]CAA6654859.1 unnamed protein product [Spirodela intermedia]
MGKGGQDRRKGEAGWEPSLSVSTYPAWARDVSECEEEFKVSADRGLSSEEVLRRRLVYGSNELEKHSGPSIWQLILEQFNDTLVRILLLAAVVSFVLAWYDGDEGGEMGITAFVEPLVIFLILIVNAAVGVWQESNAEMALEALKEIQSEHATVRREGRAGDKVPADMRILYLISSTVRVEQGSLTGETDAVNKTHHKIDTEDMDIQGKECMVFAGTTVVNGTCICLVTQTGMNTEIGKVHSQIHEASQDDVETPLKKKFSFEKCTYYFEIAVALAVAAIPEGLPAVITTCLALGTRKMAQKNALVRKLPSVETLGCTTVICSDKTGTLTTNQMSVARLVAIGKKIGVVRRFKVDGTTYDPHDGRIHDWPIGQMDPNLQIIAKIASVCNEANVTKSGLQYHANGMSTEAALKVLVEKMGLPAGSDVSHTGKDSVYCCQYWNSIAPRVATLEFDRSRKSMGVIVKSDSGGNMLFVKGAVENLLERSTYLQLLDGSIATLDERSRKLILRELQAMSSKFATYDGEYHPAHRLLLDPSNYSSIESDLIFVGLVGLRDPPREEVHKAIEDCRAAGIQVMVITGDNKDTAEAICCEIGVFEPGEDISSKSITGKEFMHLSDKKKYLRQSGGLLFSRAEPKHKQEIVRLLKEDGEVVAMTGDGVNDAPALKLADIGIAMGITGTEVAKEASDMVLADDNFSTIVAAVGEGRSIYNNMKAFIRYMISSNIGEVASIFLTAALGIPEGLIPVQLLWVNLVTDGPPATALGFNPPDKDIIGLYVGIATVGVFIIWYTHGSFLGIDLSSDGHTLVTYSQLSNWGRCSTWEGFKVSPFTAVGKVKATTLSLSVLVAIEMFNSLNALSEDGSLLTMPPWVNPWLLAAMSVSFGLHFLILYVPILAQVFGIVPLSFNEWLLVLAVAFPVILIDEVLKFIGRCTSGSRTRRRSQKHKKD